MPGMGHCQSGPGAFKCVPLIFSYPYFQSTFLFFLAIRTTLPDIKLTLYSDLQLRRSSAAPD
jgi:hypothetical protein